MTITPELPNQPLGLGTVMEPSARKVAAAEFKQLIVSHRRLTRADQPELGLRGLRDLDSGEFFVTEERRLHDAGRG